MAYTDIDDPSAYFQTALFTGNAGTNAITNTGNSDLQPDWVWFKCRSAAEHHGLFDSVRGVTKAVYSNLNTAQDNLADSLASFNSDGFTMGADTGSGGAFNGNTKTMVAWQWKETATAGFDIVSYTGNGTAGKTVAHSLSAVPKMIIVKRYNDGTASWMVYHHTLGNNIYLSLDTTAASDTGHWDSTSPTSSVFSVSGDQRVNNNGASYIAYCFAEKQGYSKFGAYPGNGNANGPFIFLGFRPAFLMIKGYAGTDNWIMYDNKRSGYNSENEYLDANNNDAESDGTGKIDFLSNGFKIKSTFSSNNYSTGEYIYMAFAEQPFVTSTGVPATAR